MKKLIFLLLLLLLTTPALAQVEVQGLPVVTSATANDYMLIEHYISAGVFTTSKISLANLIGVDIQAYYLNLTTVGALTNSAGGLTNDGAGNFSYVAYLPAAGTGLADKIGATFDYRSAATPIPVNSIAYINIPYAVSAINSWNIDCTSSDATGIIIDVLGITHTLNTLPTATYCASGTKPNVANGASTSPTTPPTWNCSTTSFVANTDIAFKVITAPTTSQYCTITLKVTR